MTQPLATPGASRPAHLFVVAGIHIVNGRLLLARRPLTGDLPGLWELPGGKVEPGETPAEALVRELAEELGVVAVGPEPYAFRTVKHGERRITLLFLTIRGILGTPRPIECLSVRRVTPAEAPLLSLAPPDREIVERLVAEGFRDTETAETPRLLESAREEGPYLFGSESLGDEPITFVKRRDGKIIRGLLVRTALGPAAYENTCPHVPIPLDRDGESLLSEDGRHLVCNNHGALFERETGLCVSGPCAGERLRPIPIAPEGEGVRLLP